MSKQIEAMLEAMRLKYSDAIYDQSCELANQFEADLLVINKALAEQPAQQEPVAFPDAPKIIYLQVCDEMPCGESFYDHHDVSWCEEQINNSDIEYIRADTAPPSREWVGLTDEDIDLYALDIGVTANKAPAWLVVYAKDIEAKLKEKNT